MTPETFLRDICEQLFFPLRITIRSEKTRYQYRLAIGDFAKHIGHEPTIADLQDDLLTIWMSRLLDLKLAIDTVRERVGRVQTLWAWLARRGVVNRWPTVIKPPAPEPLPLAMTEAQLRSLFRSAAKERGDLDGVPADLWWMSFLAFIWNTSERKGAVLACRPEWFNLDPDRPTCVIPPEARKGRRKWGVYDLYPEIMPLIRALINVKPGRELMWPWPRHWGSYYTAYNRILKDAEIPVTRKHKTHGLRCSHATWLKVMGGDPTKQLGHGDAATTNRHYIDPRLLRNDQPKLFIPWTPPPPRDLPPAA